MLILIHTYLYQSKKQTDPKDNWDLTIFIFYFFVEKKAWIFYQIFMAFLENINFIRDLKMGVERKLV